MLPLFLSIVLLISSSKVSEGIPTDLLTCLQTFNNSTEDIYTPQNTTFSTIFQSSVQNPRVPTSSPLKPTAILTPRKASQIQAAIYCSKKLALLIRVRSGGHDYEGLSYASPVPFIIVDLRNLRKISIDTQKKEAWIEAGATLGELYHAIGEKSSTLAFPGGTCPTVGVGGHISGGGYGMLARNFGLAADRVIDAKIIDSQGRILDRKAMGKDLFWAIRGGGAASFGIVTAWKVKLVTIPETVTVFNVTKTIETNGIGLFHRWQYIAHKIDEKLLIRAFVNVVDDNSSPTGDRSIQVVFLALYVGGVDDLLLTMKKEFPELGLGKADCTEMRWIQAVLYFAYIPIDQSAVLLNRTSYGISFKGLSDFVEQPISKDGIKEIFERLRGGDAPFIQMQFSPYGGKMAEISKSELPFPHRAGNLAMLDYGASWGQDQKSNAQKYITWARKLFKFMAPYVSKSPRRAYLNYRDLDLGFDKNLSDPSVSYKQARKWGVKYFINNFKRLVHVKSIVDPSNFFRNEQSIPPFQK